MSNEVKIGILAIVSVIVGIWGFYFMKGQKLFSNNLIVYVHYDNVDGLAASAPITVNGFNIGQVTQVTMDNATQKLTATLSIDPGINIHKNALAQITSASIMGGKEVQIANNKLCNGADCVPYGGTINGEVLGILGSMIPQGEVDEYMTAIQGNVGKIVDELNEKINEEDPDNTMGKTIRDLQLTMENLKLSTAQMNRIMQQNAANLNTTMSNFAQLSKALADNNDKITLILENTDTFTKDLSKMNLSGTMATADTALNSANIAVKQLETTLVSSEKMVASLNEVLAKVKNGQGTLGKLMQDQTLYDNLTKSTKAMDEFLTDFKEKPYRYMPLKSRRKVLKHDRKDAEAEGN